MSYGDSSAVFEQRALHMGLSPEVLKQFVDKGFHNMALFAFSCNYAAELSILRRLFNESYANVAADIESQVKQTDESVSRRLAPAERAERLRIQQRKLVGLAIWGQYEPADALVDKCCAAYESDRLSYVESSLCISREYELQTMSRKILTCDSTVTELWSWPGPQRSSQCKGCQRFKCATHWCAGGWHWTRRTFWIIQPCQACWVITGCSWWSPQLGISVCQWSNWKLLIKSSLCCCASRPGQA